MNKNNINELSAETEADSNSTAQNQQVSQPNANTNVSRPLPITDAEMEFMQECCLWPHWYDGKLVAAKILTEDSEGPLLDGNDLVRLSDILYRYVKGNGG